MVIAAWLKSAIIKGSWGRQVSTWYTHFLLLQTRYKERCLAYKLVYHHKPSLHGLDADNGDFRWLELNNVSRGVIVLKPKELFLDWVNSTVDEGAVLTPAEIPRDWTAYLTPEIEE